LAAAAQRLAGIPHFLEKSTCNGRRTRKPGFPEFRRTCYNSAAADRARQSRQTRTHRVNALAGGKRRSGLRRNGRGVIPMDSIDEPPTV